METRRASAASSEAWLPQSIYMQNSIEKRDQLRLTKILHSSIIAGNRLKALLSTMHRVEIFGNGIQLIMVAYRRPNFLDLFNPPILLMDQMDTENAQILRIDYGTKNIFLNEIRVDSSTGILGFINSSYVNGTKTYDVYDAYKQLVFYITPNLTPNRAMEFLILGPERSLLTAAFFKREEDYALEIFKPLSPILKTLLLSFSLFILFTYAKC